MAPQAEDDTQERRVRAADRHDVLLVERGRPLLMTGIGALLRAEDWPGSVEGPVAWRDAASRCATHPPRLVLIEYPAAPSAEAADVLVELVAGLRIASPFTKAVVVADEAEERLDEVIVVDAARAGAVAVVRTLDRTEALLTTMREAASGSSTLPVERVSTLARGVEESRRRVREAAHRVASLTDREREILARLGWGMHNQQIARDLTISVRTVEKHIQHILQKLAVDSRGQAVSILAELRGTA